MKKRLLHVGALLTLTLVNAQQQQDSTKVEQLKEAVVIATKTPNEKKNIGKIVYVISPEVIEQNQGKTIVDLLNDVPSVEINGNYSTRGQNLGYYIRGGRNRQVAILIDGINVSDPSSFNGDFDLRLIPLEQVEKVEILKGAASTLYGTGAATGVINIILKKSDTKRFSGSFTTDIGTNSSQEKQKLNLHELNNNFSINGTIGKFNYLLGLNGSLSRGLSAAESNDESIEFEEDSFNRVNSLLKLGYAVTDKLNVSIFGSYDEFRSEFDGFDFITNSYVDANNEGLNIQKRIGLTPTYKYVQGEFKLNAFYTKVDRIVEPSNDIYEGEVYGFDVYNNYKFSNQFSALIGFTAQFQDIYQNTAFSSIQEGSAEQYFYDPYISFNYNSDFGFNMNTGARLNIHNEYGSNWVYNINPSYNFDWGIKTNLKIFASYSTAFVTPTLQEIFNKFPTLDQLNPESDYTVEGGVEFTISNKFSINATYFYREEKDKIGFDFTTFQTINDTGTFIARGIEAETVFNPTDKLKIALNYGYINRDESLLLKVPKHKLGLNVAYNLSKNSLFTINGKFVDATSDFGGVNLPSYRVVDIFLNHRLIKDRLTIFGSITNTLNEDYQEIAGFSTRGRNYKVGLRLNF